MKCEAGMLGEPGHDVRRLVGADVVEHDVQLACGIGPLDPTEEGQEVVAGSPIALPRLAPSTHSRFTARWVMLVSPLTRADKCRHLLGVGGSESACGYPRPGSEAPLDELHVRHRTWVFAMSSGNRSVAEAMPADQAGRRAAATELVGSAQEAAHGERLSALPLHVCRERRLAPMGLEVRRW